MSGFLTVSPEWDGETAFLLGCGPSLCVDDVDRLRGRRVIAINDAYLLAPWAEYLYFCDQSWWDQNRDQVEEIFYGRRIVTLRNEIDGVSRLRCSGVDGLETDPGAIRHGCNSGYQAINFAYHLGAKLIVLLGYDMRVDGDKLHWRQRQGMQTADGFHRTLRHAMLPKFASLVEPLRNARVDVINCTPGSVLRYWPILSLKEVLEGENG